MNNYEIKDNISPYLKKLFQISEGLGFQAMNKSGHEIRGTMASMSKNLGSHRFGQRIVDGRRTLVSTRDGEGKPYYSRVSHRTGKRETDMGELVRYKLYEDSRTLLVGWINVKGYRTKFYNGGVPSPGNYVKGTKTKDIARVMAEGGRIPLTDNQRKLFMRSGWGRAAKRGYVERQAHRYMNFGVYLGTAARVAHKEFIQAVKQFEQTA